MQAIIQDYSQARSNVPRFSYGKRAGWGMIGGLIATMIMDLVLICTFLFTGMPWFSCFSIVGDTVARLFPYQGMVNSVSMGVAAHYLIGPVLGGIFGIAAQFLPALQAGSWKKTILFAVLYAEIVSQPLLALTPIFLRMTATEMLLWFGGSFGMHIVWGCMLGVIWRLGRRRDVLEKNSP